MSEITLIVGKRIRKIRKSKKLTLEQLAERCELHPVYIGQLERGEKNASLTTLEKVACALEISLVSLLEYSTANTENPKNIPADCRNSISSMPPETHPVFYSLLKQIVNLDK